MPVKATGTALPADELLLTVSCPDTAPSRLGKNWIVSVVVAPGLREIGKAPPMMEKPVPVIVGVFTVTADVPADFRVSNSVEEVPTVTVPKFRLVVLTVKTGLGATAPVPERATVEVLPVLELLPIVNWPVAALAVVGANFT